MVNPVVILSLAAPRALSVDPPGGGIVAKIDALAVWLAEAIRGLSHVSVSGLATKAATVVAAYVAVRVAVAVARRALRRRVAASGYRVRVVPPRTVDVASAAEVWRLLHALARRASAGVRWSKPPLAVEVHAREGRLTWCLAVPAWVPLAVVRAEAEQAWPGAVVQPWQPDTDDDTGTGPESGWRFVAGCRLAVYGTDNASLVRDEHMGGGADPLRAVLSSLAQAGGPAVLQVLVRPPSRWRMRALRRAAAGKPPRKAPALIAIDGVLSLVVTLLTEAVSFLLPGPSRSSRTAGYESGTRSAAPDPLQRQAMRDAQAKLSDRPHLEAAVRVMASGKSRAEARTAARSVMDSYAVAGGDLTTVRLSRPVQAVRDRWAGARQWLLVSCSELGVLAHIPADPAWYGFGTAALNRPYPKGARLAEPEKPRPDASGWTGRKWTPPAQRSNNWPDDTWADDPWLGQRTTPPHPSINDKDSADD